MKIGKREIGDGRVYVIAELGVNHDGSATRAMELVEAAAGAGVDAIKLQYFETDRLMSKSAKLAAYQKAAGETDPIAMLRRLEMPIDAMGPLVDRAHALGMHAIVTVFSTELVDNAEALAWDAYKVASPDLVHKPLLERLARTGRPLILSTGAATLDEVNRTVGWMGEWGARKRLALMQCVSSYPTPPEHAALGGIGALIDSTGLSIGYSDHTSIVETGAIAARLGACMLEKHLTYDRRAAGPDHAASLEPADMAQYVALTRRAREWPDEEFARQLGSSSPETGARSKTVLPIEQDVRRVSRQSVVAARSMAPGHVVTTADLTIKRPGTGIPAAEIGRVIGKRVIRAVETDTTISWDCLAQ